MIHHVLKPDDAFSMIHDLITAKPTNHIKVLSGIFSFLPASVVFFTVPALTFKTFEKEPFHEI
jgi:hypothetical protein